MYTKNVFAVSGALIAAVTAVPMAKRDIVWVTQTQEDVVTMPVTTTVWVNPGETVPTGDASHFGHHHHHSSKVTSTIQSTVTVPSAPASTPESSAESTSEVPSSTYVAPTPSSTSVYVAPTTSSTSVYVAPTTSSTSIYVAPTTSTTSEYVAPSPTSVYVAPTTTSAAPAATSAASSGSGLTGMAAPGTSYSGDMTWYQDGLGACGFTNGPSDKIVAISESLFDLYTVDGNPNKNPLCGKTVTITGVDGTEHQAEIVDRCTGCKDADLDLSEDFFNTVTSNGDGRVHNVSWKFD